MLPACLPASDQLDAHGLHRSHALSKQPLLAAGLMALCREFAHRVPYIRAMCW